MAAILPKDVRIQYEIEAWELRRQFWTQERIANKLGISKQAVSKMLARVERRELAKFQKRVERTKARQTAQLETIATEAYEAWLHSKTPQIIEKAEVGGAGEAAGANGAESAGDVRAAAVVLRETKTHQCDSSLLNQVRGALSDIRAIWGIEAPAKATIETIQKGFHTSNDPDAM
jgi:DNA-binding MarR family transcriptional regulator